MTALLTATTQRKGKRMNDEVDPDRRRLLQIASLLAVSSPGIIPKTGYAWPVRENKNRTRVRDLEMAWYEVGEGDPIVFIHGNPTSSYQWRNIIPYVEHLGRCIAPDMVGMGDSDPLPGSGPGRYTYFSQRDYMYELFKEIGIEENVIFVVHDWGSAMGFEWSYRNPERVRGIAYYEPIVSQSDAPRPEPTQGPFAILRSPAGESAVLTDNMFVEQMLIDRLDFYLSEEDKAEYRRPFLEPGESRRPTLTWPREVPMGGEPAVNEEVISEYSAWLATDERIPKLFIKGTPGAILASEPLLEFVQGFPNQREVGVYGMHHLQDTAPDAIGRALADWIPSL
jgi:haloalkane dehalogenase